jgi:hypothetical protein
MDKIDYKYDVAFSFVQKDEPLTNHLYKLLKDRMSCFLYSEEQKKLAGRDGENIFNSVFSKESRIVVVLFSKDWGKTKWTRIEETAIKNKGFDEGYDFVILIPTEKEITPPKWLPKNRIWVGLDRWGVESAASVIEAKVIEFDGSIKSESIADKIKKTENNLIEKKKREILLDSGDGLKLAFNEVSELKKEIVQQKNQINDRVKDWHFVVRDNNQNGCDIISYGFFLTFHFYQKYSNSADGAYLMISLWNGIFDINGYAVDPFSKNELISTTRLRFDINEYNQRGWSDIETRQNFISSNRLVENWIESLIDTVAKERQARNF